MRLLVCTQKVDRNDPVLGFFHHWLAVFASRWESIIVLCLEQGETALPDNVRVVSLGKEQGRSLLRYLWRFYRTIFRERNAYDAVYVHMNQEYVLLGGIFWRLFGKRIALWRNHHAGTWRTRLAGIIAHRVMCTSRYSYTATFRNTTVMPVGVDTDQHAPGTHEKNAGEIVFLARIAPSKKPHVLLDALALLRDTGTPFTAKIIGDPLPEHRAYAEQLRAQSHTLGLDTAVTFLPAIPNHATTEVYRACAVFVNLSSDGMFDKTIFEAMACSTLVCVSNKNLDGQIDSRCLFPQDDAVRLSERLRALLALQPSAEPYQTLASSLRSYVVAHHSLSALSERIATVLTSDNRL